MPQRAGIADCEAVRARTGPGLHPGDLTPSFLPPFLTILRGFDGLDPQVMNFALDRMSNPSSIPACPGRHRRSYSSS